MKQLLIVLSTIYFSQKSIGQDSIRVKRQYDNDRPVTAIDSFYHKMPNTIFISLDEGFDDSVYVTVNDTIVLNQYLKSNESIGYAGGLGIHFNDASEMKTLKIMFVKANLYIQEILNLKYKSLQIRGLRPWLLIYTNRFPLRE